MFHTDRDETEKQLVAAATDLMMEKNSNTVNMNEVAAHCGKSRVTVKKLFRSSEELVRQCFRYALSDMQEVLYWHSVKSISLRDKLISICSDYYDLGRNRPGVIILFLRSLSSNHHDNSFKFSTDHAEEYFNEAGEVLRYGVASGEIREGTDVYLAAKMFIVSLLNLLARSIMEKDFNLPSSESVVDQLFNGIKA